MRTAYPGICSQAYRPSLQVSDVLLCPAFAPSNQALTMVSAKRTKPARQPITALALKAKPLKSLGTGAISKINKRLVRTRRGAIPTAMLGEALKLAVGEMWLAGGPIRALMLGTALFSTIFRETLGLAKAIPYGIRAFRTHTAMRTFVGYPVPDGE